MSAPEEPRAEGTRTIRWYELAAIAIVLGLVGAALVVGPLLLGAA